MMPQKTRRRSPACRLPVERLEARRLLASDFATTAPNPTAVVAMDLDQDGVLDLLTANRGGTTISILTGRDGGSNYVSFSNAQVTGTAPTALAVANFDNDSLPDLAVANYGTSSVRILTGNGTSLSSAATYAVGANPVSLVTSDFSGDGRPDLVTANADGTITLLLGVAGPGFQASTTTIGSSLVSAATGDLNRDGRVDLAVLGADGTVTVLYGSGGLSVTSVFATRTTVALGANATGLAVADFDGDGRLDLAASRNTTGGSVALAFGTANGTFAAGGTYAVGASPTGLVAGDFNGDAKPDLVVANGGANTLSVLIGRGSGTFLAAPAVPVGTNPTGLFTGDLNNDGRLDVACANNASPGSVSVRYGLGDGTFVGTTFGPATTTPTTPGIQPTTTVTADVNNDGKTDVLAACQFNGRVQVLLGDGNGGVSSPTNLTFAGGPIAVVPADYNGDGNIDLAAATTGNGVLLALGNGNGTFATPTSFVPSAGVRAVVGGDFNSDGRPDLAFVDAQVNLLYLLRNNGAGGFSIISVATNGLVTNAQALVTGDFNGDGRPDLAISGTTSAGSRVVPMLGDGSGTYFSGQAPLNAIAVRNGLAAGDFNGDGFDDLAALSTADDKLVIFQSVGNGLYQSATYATGDTPSAIATADFTGDGRNDLAVTDYTPSSGTAGAVRLMIGSRTLPTTVPLLQQNTAVDAPSFGDLNGDGHPDLVTVGSTGGSGIYMLWPSQVASFPYAVAAGGVATVNGAAGGVTVGQSKGAITLTGPLGTQRLDASTLRSVVLSGVNATLGSDLGQINGGKLALTVNADTTATLSSTQHLTSLTVNGVASMTAGRKLLRVTGLNVSGRLDLNDSDLIYDYAAAAGQPAAVAGLIASARANGAWTGVGLTSTAARTRVGSGTTLGYLAGSDYLTLNGPTATFAGEAIDATSVVVRYTLYGDTDLDNGVSINDFNRLAADFGAMGKTWLDGDLDNDGGVSINDFNLLAANFGKTLMPPAPVARPGVGVAPAKAKR